ncbi:hypothetical protein [Actinomadura sp. GTD37]|uniref:hypothetical protein n=1 Tax=Actinomadura sp. GTD37 TaxID=1778030 RepID=UPI0035C10DB1
MILRGDYVLPVKPDVVPVSDGAGEVVAVGPGRPYCESRRSGHGHPVPEPAGRPLRPPAPAAAGRLPTVRSSGARWMRRPGRPR